MNHFATSMRPEAGSAHDKQKRTRLSRAIRVLSEQEPPDVQHRMALAEAEFRLALLPGSDLQESIDHLQRAIAYDSLHPKFFFHMGRCLYLSGDFRGAVQEYRHTLKLAPGSHRVFVHLALALLELDKDERKVGQKLLDALMRGAEHEIPAQLTLLDDLEKKAQQASSAEQEKDQSPDEEGAPSSMSSEQKGTGKAKVGNKAKAPKQPVIESRWPGVWWLAFASQLSVAKPNQKQMNKALEKGEKMLASGQNIAEYAVLCLCQLLTGAEPAEIQDTLTRQLKVHADHPAVQLLQSALTLKQIPEAEQFVETASKELRIGMLPLEVVCCLHLTQFGVSSSLSASEALRILEAYPQDIRQERSFCEMRLALLDGYAHQAWSEDHYEHARLLWRETIPLDPFRVAVAHNLALVAARTKAVEDYTPAWERATELRYLYAAAANDVQVYLEERRAMHLAIAQQSQQRHYPSSHPKDDQEEVERLSAWLADREALETWLREWDLYYLNSRLGFRSPIHLLGIVRDASPETVAEAQEAFLQQINLSLRDQNWAGIQTFCQLAEQVIKRAAEQASSNIERIRDPYYADEKATADALANEAISHGTLLDDMLLNLMDRLPESALTLGCAIARKLFALPWVVLQPLCVRRGLLSADKNLVEIFEQHFMAFLLLQLDDSQVVISAAERLSALQEGCIILPQHAPVLKWHRATILKDTGRKAEAYTCALESLFLSPALKDQELRATLEQRIANFIDDIAFSELPDKWVEMDSQEALKKGRSIIELYPRAGGFRILLAKYMETVGMDKIDAAIIQEAIHLLEQGVPLALNEEQRQTLADQLAKLRPLPEKILILQQIKALLESAYARLPSIKQASTLWEARQAFEGAMRDADQARMLARDAQLPDIESQAEELYRQLQKGREQLDRQF